MVFQREMAVGTGQFNLAVYASEGMGCAVRRRRVACGAGVVTQIAQVIGMKSVHGRREAEVFRFTLNIGKIARVAGLAKKRLAFPGRREQVGFVDPVVYGQDILGGMVIHAGPAVDLPGIAVLDDK